jgi:hypothetical protein
MPVGWMRFPTGTAPEVEQFRDDPQGLEAFVRNVVEVEGEPQRLEALYFDVGREVAYALVFGLDDFIAIRAARRILGAEAFTKLLRVEDAVRAVERERFLRGPRSQ